MTVLDKLTYAGNEANLDPVATSPRYTFVEGDICDAGLLGDVMAGQDAVVHFAAESHVDRSITGAADFVMTNVLGTQQLLQAALNHDVDRFVHVSTDEVYGSIPVGSWPETPVGAQLAVLRLEGRFRPAGPGVRAHLRHGRADHPLLQQLRAYQFPEKVIPLFVTNLMDGLPVPLYGEGQQRAGLAARRRPLPRHPAGARQRPGRGSTTSAVARS